MACRLFDDNPLSEQITEHISIFFFEIQKFSYKKMHMKMFSEFKLWKILSELDTRGPSY